MAREIQQIGQPCLSLFDKSTRFSRRLKTQVRKFKLDNSALTSRRLVTQRAEPGVTQVVVSLTTYGSRLDTVHLVVESIAAQSFRPARLILWLDEVECQGNLIPAVLQRQIERGLEVRFCANYKSYKKLIPTLEICPEATIITIDDDVLYPEDMVEQLVAESLVFPYVVISHRARRIKMVEAGLAPYHEWDFISTEELPSSLTIPIGLGGILYPPNTFHADISTASKFLYLAPNADDIWFKTMSLLRGVKCKKVSDTRAFNSRFLDLPGSQKEALHHSNLYEHENDRQIESVFKAYDIYNLINP